MKKRVLVPLAPGFEELEATAAIDYLRRAGAHVVTASVDAPNPIRGRNKMRVMADIDLEEALTEWGDQWDLLVLPGGPAVEKLAASEALMGLLTRRLVAGGQTAAICAAPTLLAKAGLKAGTKVTSYPSTQGAIESSAEVEYLRDAVVVDGSIVTSRGPGTAIAFALACVEALFGADKAAEIKAETVS